MVMMVVVALFKAQSSARGRRETEKSRRLGKQDTGREWLLPPACEVRQGEMTRL